MIFKATMALRGQEIISSIEKDKGFCRVELDRFKNRTLLLFDSIAFDSFVQALNEYREKGKVSFSPSESCRGQADLESILLDLSEDQNFSINFDLGDARRGICFFKIRSDHAGVFLCFNEDQMNKIILKFKAAAAVKDNLREAEERTPI